MAPPDASASPLLPVRLRAAYARVRGPLWALLCGACTALAVATTVALSGHADADARAQYSSAYGFDRTWNAAVRLLRVDLGAQVLEKDELTGYVLFEYNPGDTGGKKAKGAFEFVGGREPGQSVQVVVQLPELPRYHEQSLVDQLSRKLRQDYGDPPPPRAKPSKPKEPTAGDESASDEPAKAR